MLLTFNIHLVFQNHKSTKTTYVIVIWPLVWWPYVWSILNNISIWHIIHSLTCFHFDTSHHSHHWSILISTSPAKQKHPLSSLVVSRFTTVKCVNTKNAPVTIHSNKNNKTILENWFQCPSSNKKTANFPYPLLKVPTLLIYPNVCVCVFTPSFFWGGGGTHTHTNS